MLDWFWLRQRPRLSAFIGCAALLSLFALLGYGAASQKSATFDEPLKSTAAWAIRFEHDFRVSPEDPPLWLHWASLGYAHDIIRTDTQNEVWRTMPENTLQRWRWAGETLFRTPGNNAQSFIMRARVMLLLLGVGLGAIIAAWAWRIGGPVAAIAALIVFVFDPNILAHSAIVKNDVATALCFGGACFAVWLTGWRATATSVFTLCVFTGAATCMKFSGVILPPLVIGLLFVRALLPAPWPFFGRQLLRIPYRLLAAGALSIAVIVGTGIVIWASYDFRFAPTPDPSVRLNNQYPLYEIEARTRAKHPDQSSPGPFQQPLAVRAALVAESHHLLPQAYTNGLLQTSMYTISKLSFLAGELSLTGWWYYFPLAFLFKTPLATLAILGLTPVMLLMPAEERAPSATAPTGWTPIVLVIPPLIFMILLSRSSLDLGLRYMLPVYPFLFVMIGAAASRACARLGRYAVVSLLVIASGLAIETLSGFPDYLSFFNAASGGARGGIHLLSDSNLDWGQDLIALSKWQKKNPGDTLYLAYFGVADPAQYGINYKPLRGGFTGGQTPGMPEGAGVVAVSATVLQGIHLPPELRAFYSGLAKYEPREVLGGTIYLYDFPLRNKPARADDPLAR